MRLASVRGLSTQPVTLGMVTCRRHLPAWITSGMLVPVGTPWSVNFTMPDVPVGANIPVVIQTGKWRRQITLPMVKACQDNVFAGTDTFRLPKNQ